MSGIQSLTPYEPDAYEVIARAMAESERGRWFLDEHARRNRGPDTGTLLDAIARVESAVTAQRLPDDVGQMRGNLIDMANAISRTKAEIAAISAPDQDQSRLGTASEALDAIVRTTERATSDILGAAEEVQEAAWLLRERGVEAEFCDRLDRHATQIYTACSFQDLTAQRTSRIVHTLRYLEDRLTAMIAIWDAEGARVPPAPDAARAAPAPDLCQSDVDRFIDAEAPAIAAAPFLGATALDDDLAFVEVPVEPEAECVTEGSGALATEVTAEDEADAFEFAALGPAPEVDEIAFEVAAEADETAFRTEASARTEIAGIVPQVVAVPEIEAAAAAPMVGEITVAAFEADADASLAIAEALEEAAEHVTDAPIEEPILDAAELAEATAFPADQDLDIAEPDAAFAAATLPAPTAEVQAEAPAPAEADKARTAEPARLDDIDLLSVEEKLALFS